MNEKIKEFMQVLEENDIKYVFSPNKENLIIVRYSLEANPAITLNLMVFFDEDESDVQIRIYGFGKAVDINQQVFAMMNDLNKRYRWYHIYTDAEQEFVLQTDMMLSDLQAAGKHIFGRMLMGLMMANEMYPDVMRALWAPIA